MIQFGTIKFRRTFKTYFGQFVWIEKKVTIIVVFHFMKRRLKINTNQKMTEQKKIHKKRLLLFSCQNPFSHTFFKKSEHDFFQNHEKRT